jgi:WD40 repeat protein
MKVNSILLKNDMLYSVSDDKSLRVWNVETGDCISYQPSAHGDPVISITSFGKNVVTADKTGKFREWYQKGKNFKNDRQIHLDSEETKELVEFGDELISTSGDAIKAWEFKNSTCTAIFESHLGEVTSLLVADGKLISASEDCKVKIWKR